MLCEDINMTHKLGEFLLYDDTVKLQLKIIEANSKNLMKFKQTVE